MANKITYFHKNKLTLIPVNPWDLVVFLFIFGIIALLAIGAKDMVAPFTVGQSITIHLDPTYLPGYALRTTVRMFIALTLSLLFTFVFGSWAAKSKHAERIIIPAIDILQSVPVLGFLSISVMPFIALFPGSLLGPECAAIFAIFTAQAWNMALSLYQSIRTVPKDLLEASDMLHLSSWQRFWRVEVPFAMPALLWNTMMSMSASWFFVVASEAISVSNQEITLPGIGSYIALAITKANWHGVVYAIVAMFMVILIYDQIIFRPLIKWSEKFTTDSTAPENGAQAWLTRLLQRTYALKYLGQIFAIFTDSFVNFFLFNRQAKPRTPTNSRLSRILEIIWYVFVFIATSTVVVWLGKFILDNIAPASITNVIFLGLATASRVFVSIIISSMIWIPLGVWIGLRPNIAKIAQPILQFLAAFPAYLLFPVVVMIIVKFNLNVEIWTTPLMILGTQWYIAFNVIAGTTSIPKDLHYAINNVGASGWLRWKRFILPAIFPYYITGAITAAGGAWNMSIVAEVISWGQTKLVATGLGAYITEYTTRRDFPQIALGIGIMCLYVLVFNRVLWRPLYLFAEKRFRME